MTNDELMSNAQMTKRGPERAQHHLDLVIPSSLGIRHSSFYPRDTSLALGDYLMFDHTVRSRARVRKLW
jgi:hypothetical protein